MKAVVALAVRVTLNSLALLVSFIVAFAVTGMARMETQSETASAAQAAATLPPLLLYDACGGADRRSSLSLLGNLWCDLLLSGLVRWVLHTRPRPAKAA